MVKANQTAVSKTVRLPLELVEFVNAQEGKDFTSKLIKLLLRYEELDEDYKKTLVKYDELINHKREHLNELNDAVYKAEIISTRARSYFKTVVAAIGAEEEKNEC